MFFRTRASVEIDSPTGSQLGCLHTMYRLCGKKFLEEVNCQGWGVVHAVCSDGRDYSDNIVIDWARDTLGIWELAKEDKKGRTPAWLACSSGRYFMFEELLRTYSVAVENSFKVKDADTGLDAVGRAKELGHTRTIDVLKTHGVDTEFRVSRRSHPAHRVAAKLASRSRASSRVSEEEISSSSAEAAAAAAEKANLAMKALIEEEETERAKKSAPATKKKAETGRAAGAPEYMNPANAEIYEIIFGSQQPVAGPGKTKSKKKKSSRPRKVATPTAPEKGEEWEWGDAECVLCLSHPPEMCCIPCGHMAVCRACHDGMLGPAAGARDRPRLRECPICREFLRGFCDEEIAASMGMAIYRA